MAIIEVRSVIAGSVWQIEAKLGDKVSEDMSIMVLESMKMEIPVLAPEDGVVRHIHVEIGQPVAEGDLLATLEG